MDISDCTQIHIDMELNYKFTIKLIKSKLNPCDVGYGESFLKPGASSSKLFIDNPTSNQHPAETDLISD